MNLAQRVEDIVGNKWGSKFFWSSIWRSYGFWRLLHFSSVTAYLSYIQFTDIFRDNPNWLQILITVFNFGVVLLDSILATED